MRAFAKKSKTTTEVKKVLDYIECEICGEKCPSNQDPNNFDSVGYNILDKNLEWFIKRYRSAFREDFLRRIRVKRG